MIDFPGKVSAILFTRGCNLRCAYCHNPELLEYNASQPDALTEEELDEFLEKRKGRLDGIVITGGEPTLQADLADFCAKLKKMGYLVKLDTNGTNPQVVEDLLKQKLVDFIAMDIKAPFEKYAAITGVEANSTVLQQSIDLIRQSGLAYQFRTTYDKEVLTDSDIAALNQLTEGKNYKVQECLPVAKEKAALKVMHEEL